MKPGIYFDISNEDYHAGDGVSKSQLDMVAKNPALLKWVQAAPEDEEKKSALDMGTALHCLLLEPGEFDKRFIVSPKFDRRTKQGKADEEAFLRDVADMGITVLDAEQWRKLELMRDSAMAHPAARWMLEAPGYCEASMYWNDEETGELCRIRPDKWLNEHNVIVDVKKVADMDRFARHIEEFRYHVQDAMYREGAMRVTVSQDDVFHITVGMYRKRLGTTNLFDTVTFSRSRRLACFKQLLCSNQFFSRFCQADTVTPILPDYQRFAATVDTVVVAKRDRA